MWKLPEKDMTLSTEVQLMEQEPNVNGSCARPAVLACFPLLHVSVRRRKNNCAVPCQTNDNKKAEVDFCTTKGSETAAYVARTLMAINCCRASPSSLQKSVRERAWLCDDA
ncbi:hypothetical protein F442_07813 [Phytophthora nicotianae P10297]|uniref:Uncharacterized protein n=1 Tax=Phytophthora nicotianae P10297 TaxID=1317064 RepID=W2ZFH6_PHYNI|nr:hypothetical protein F442_07813 [Phytophthora nicotianae P10297]